MGLVEEGGGDPSSSSSSSRPHHTQQPHDIKTVKFTLGKGNKTDAKLVVVHKGHITDDSHLDSNSKGGIRVGDKQRMPEFIKSVLLHEEFLGPKPPKVLISVTGAAAAYNMDAKLAQVFCKGLVNAAKSTTAWIVSGGTDVGVMHYVGEANRTSVADVPTIGFATYNMINNKELLKTPSEVAEYDATAPFNAQFNVNLNANHSHFVLIEGNTNEWGQEIEARSDFEEYICSTFKLPLCLIVVNGGPGTLNTVAEGVTRQFPVVIFEGTGRAADAIAREVRMKRNLPYAHLQQMNITPQLRVHLDKIIANEHCITLYSADQGPFDLEILKAILTYEHGSLQKKMELAVHWNRPDLADHLLEAANDNKEQPISPEDFNNVLSKALELSLDIERPALFRLLTTKGARKTEIDLNVLYTQETDAGPKLDVAIERYTPYLPTAGRWTGLAPAPNARSSTNVSIAQSPDQSRSFLLQTQDKVQQEGVILSEIDQNFVKTIFTAVHPVFHHYAKILPGKFNHPPPTAPSRAERRPTLTSEIRQSDVSMHPVAPIVDDAEANSGSTKVHYTDAMLWAIVMGKLELAKVIWEETTLPVHAALLASGLCKGIAGWLLNEQQAFMDAAAWFEQVAVTLIEKLSYENAKTMLTYLWAEVRHDAIQIAAMTECKDFVGNVHVQRYMDELLYSNEKGGIPPGTNFLRVLACIVFPFILFPSKTYANFLKEKEKGSAANAPQAKTGNWYHFYGLPYTKFWTSTFCYIGYLALLSVVLVSHQNETKVSAAEWVLWFWMFAYAVEEVSQAQEEGWSYLKYTSNQMDIFIMALQVCYVSCAGAAAHASHDPGSTIHLASRNLLIVTTIISFVRFLDVFSISKDLGPLYYVMKKIIDDVFRWIFVFILFAIGFQVAFMALAHEDQKWSPTIKGGVFMGAIYTILGDDTTIQDLAFSHFGSIVVALYAIIAQIMLVNLLIAMMGDTFNSVKENSDKDWKFFRYHLIVEYSSASFHPPPFNLVAIPLKKLIRAIRDSDHPEYSDLPVNEMNAKQREKFKNLMKDVKDEYLADREEEDTKTISSVSEVMKENFKLVLDEQDVKYRSLEKQITDMREMVSKIQPSIPSLSSSTTNNNNNNVDMGSINASLNVLVKTELGKMHDSLVHAVKGDKTPESMVFRIQNKDIPVTWNEGVQKELVSKMLHEYKPFAEWVKCMNKPDNVAYTQLRSINVQAIDMFGPRIGFVKFQSKVVNEAGADIPGIVFMRGAAVGILVILKLHDPDGPEHGKEFTILTIQPRVPTGESRFAEIPAGMLDGGKFAGVAAKELKEETGIDIQEDKLVDLTGLAYGNNHAGMFPSAGGCDEYLRLFLYRTTVRLPELYAYQDKLTGVLEEGEKITLKVIPLDDLWFEAPDAKALSAEMLYHKVMQKGLVPANF